MMFVLLVGATLGILTGVTDYATREVTLEPEAVYYTGLNLPTADALGPAPPTHAAYERISAVSPVSAGMLHEFAGPLGPPIAAQ